MAVGNVGPSTEARGFASDVAVVAFGGFGDSVGIGIELRGDVPGFTDWVTPEEKLLLEEAARSKGFRGVSDFVRSASLGSIR